MRAMIEEGIRSGFTFQGGNYPESEGGHMTEIGKVGWLNNGPVWNEEEVLQATKDKELGQIPKKTVMVYLMDKMSTRKEPIGIMTERRISERDNNNAIGMLRLARQEFAKTEEEAKRIVIGDYV